MTVYKPTSRAALTFLLVLLVFLLALGLYILRPFMEAVAIAIIIAVAFQPLHRAVQRRVKRPTRAALLTVLTLIVVVTVPLVLILIAASGQAINAAHFVGQKSAEQGGPGAFLMSLLKRPLDFIGRYADLSRIDVPAQIADRLQSMSGRLLGLGGAFLRNLLGLIGQLVLALFTAFFLFRDGSKIVEWLLQLMPLSRERSRHLLSSIENAIIGNFYALVAVGGTQGLLVTIALLILGNRAAILLGLTASFCSLVPLVGPALVWAPVAGYLFFVGRIGAAIFLIIWGTLVIGSADNVVRPLVVGNRVQAHPLLLLLVLLGGAQAFGILGLFLGPIVLSLITAVMTTLADVNREAGTVLPLPVIASEVPESNAQS
jgi:predicted PurR-regulated permease PerM